MAPFFRDNGRQLIHEARTVGIFLDQRYTGSGGFLFTESMISQDLLNGDTRQVNPPGIGGELEAENIFGAAHGLANVPIKWIFGR
jgi:hypothetical protein